MDERKLTEKESLEVITSMIQRTKERYIGNGNIMLMWGYLVGVVSMLVWIMLVSNNRMLHCGQYIPGCKLVYASLHHRVCCDDDSTGPYPQP